ncbi:undecaprenyldiphospho-muramoylpentapeptide beta-N-acetylglucosaminyltransferase [uncultured Bacteroides sp.]|uniref:undecaprenyldiphospho-muramoylpentapeptide beta-N-acetylglucosaminyltransferase n=1 Tax=uncultured Bacteroides sp. TaxID=162156 RepID=UPI0026243173|nr:undecaprenyldiphospho-muramoylpentapeptide beta-N-acetylglucosaminyltransferase [uncultured Bacteroides sp.]
MKDNLRIIISGGGTGGHIFPALSIANAIKEARPDAEILFVGAEGRMEMQRVPAAGYKIIGLPVAGFDRKNLFNNFAVIVKLIRSQMIARKIIKDFNPHAAVGVGGYASGPTLKMAGAMGIPTLIQEQNSYAGVTNKLLAAKAEKICVAYPGMERFFDKNKIIMTGNPVRQGLLDNKLSKEEAIKSFGLDPTKKTILIIGGSLGARTLNNCVMHAMSEIKQSGVQFIWQTGKFYIEEARKCYNEAGSPRMIHTTDFISDMNAAYTAADLVVSRAGAGSISEFCLLGKPVILVPSPNVAEDHQTKNAMALVDKDAAVYIKDSEADEKLIDAAVSLVADKDKLKSLSTNIKKLAFQDSAANIAAEVCKLAEKYKDEHEH